MMQLDVVALHRMLSCITTSTIRTLTVSLKLKRRMSSSGRFSRNVKHSMASKSRGSYSSCHATRSSSPHSVISAKLRLGIAKQALSIWLSTSAPLAWTELRQRSRKPASCGILSNEQTRFATTIDSLVCRQLHLLSLNGFGTHLSLILIKLCCQ